GAVPCVNSTTLPSREIFASPAASADCAPPVATDAGRVVPVAVLRTNTSDWPFVSPPTRLLDVDSNATKRPPSLSAMRLLPPFGAAPPTPALTSSTGAGGGGGGTPTDSTAVFATGPDDPVHVTRNTSLRTVLPTVTCTVTALFCGAGNTVPAAPPDGTH